MSNIKNLKYAIYNEWSYDPPAGGVTLYYSAYGDKYADIIWPVDEIVDHLGESLYGDEYDELNTLYEKKSATRKYIDNFNWENGGLGGGCVLLAAGEDIAEAAINFLYAELDYEEEWDDADEDEEIEPDVLAEKEIIENAQKNPKDYDAVVELLDLIDEKMSDHNDGQY